MTRAKEITKEAKKFAKEIDDWEIAEDVQDAFEQGAVWADAHPHWISVEDELPPVNEAFIAYWNNFIIVQQGRDERFGNNKHISHWMPLPEAPTVAKNATVLIYQF